MTEIHINQDGSSEYEFKGVPLRIALGPRDLENDTVELARRDTLEKMQLAPVVYVKNYQPTSRNSESLLIKAKKYRDNNTHHAKDWNHFKELIKDSDLFMLVG